MEASSDYTKNPHTSYIIEGPSPQGEKLFWTWAGRAWKTT